MDSRLSTALFVSGSPAARGDAMSRAYLELRPSTRDTCIAESAPRHAHPRCRRAVSTEPRRNLRNAERMSGNAKNGANSTEIRHTSFWRVLLANFLALRRRRCSIDVHILQRRRLAVHGAIKEMQGGLGTRAGTTGIPALGIPYPTHDFVWHM